MISRRLFVTLASVMAMACADVRDLALRRVSAGETDAVAGDALEVRFRREYPVAVEELKRALKNVRCKVRRTRTEYAADAIYLVKDGSALEHMTFEKRRLRNYPDARVESYTPEFAFRLDQIHSKGPFVVRHFADTSSGLKEEKTQHSTRIRRWTRVDRFLKAAFLAFWKPVPDILSDESFKIVKIGSRKVRGTELVELEFSIGDDGWFSVGDGRWSVFEHFGSGRLVFVPQLHWALKEYDIRTTFKENPAATSAIGV